MGKYSANRTGYAGWRSGGVTAVSLWAVGDVKMESDGDEPPPAVYDIGPQLQAQAKALFRAEQEHFDADVSDAADAVLIEMVLHADWATFASEVAWFEEEAEGPPSLGGR